METAQELIEALGGGENIVGIEPCLMRIRVEVGTQRAVVENGLRLPEILAVVRSGAYVQLVAGLKTEEIAADMKSLVANVPHGTRTGPVGEPVSA